MTELIWDGKYKDGKKVAPLRVALPFQTVETVNESAQDRQHALDLFGQGGETEWRNRLIWGDKKYVLPSLLPEFAGKVDLIYIDPPFDTGANFSFTALVPGSTEEINKEPSGIEQKAYRDTWGNGLDSYLKWFYETLLMLRELLSEKGSIYVHLDDNVSHYAKCVLDEIFGTDRFLNEIVWPRTNAHNMIGNYYARVHDVILLYTKSQQYLWNRQHVDFEENQLREYRPDPDGRMFTGQDLTVSSTSKGRQFEWRGARPPANRAWAFSEEALEKLFSEGKILTKPDGVPRLRGLKVYLDERPGKKVTSIWQDIGRVGNTSGERLNYPTQKPESLLERILIGSRYKDLVETYAQTSELKLLQHDEMARYALKMATGSGKTKVMSLAIAWQYFNAVCEGKSEYAKTFLVIAPNVIVFERLRTDFANGAAFRTDPVIPDSLKIYWDMEFYMRGDGERAHSEGALYLTNIQQMHDRSQQDDDEPDVMTAMLGSKPPSSKIEVDDFKKRVLARNEPIAVINDEAHHTHDEKLKWNEIIRGLNQESDSGLAVQLDFSATPRHSKGALFSWTIFDYPLKQAIIDGIVKKPVKGITNRLEEQKSDIASVRYQPFLTAGVNRWKEYHDQPRPLKKRPILFVMMNSTTEADEVADYLRTKYPQYFVGDQLLIIHTDNTGEVSKKDLEAARKTAREVDKGDSKVNAIVSVLMLREGWDVSNVTVVVGLRPYSSKANILPEQTIGRGLRLMFRDLTKTYIERVDVIGNKGFMEFVAQLEKDEVFELESFDPEKDKLEIVSIMPDLEKLNVDISLPELSPILERKKTLEEEIRAMELEAPARPLPIKFTDQEMTTFIYEAFDVITSEKIIEREYFIPDPQTPEEVISYYAKRIAQNLKLPSQFHVLAPRVREFLETKAFGQKVDLKEPSLLRAISSNVAQFTTLNAFTKALRALVVQELSPRLVSEGKKLSVTPAYPFSKKTFDSEKTVFNKVAPDNNFEFKFAEFLHRAEDVVAFAKLPKRFGFTIDYTDNATNLRYYEPDFVAVLTDGAHVIIETKGQENIDVVHKDRAATVWAENATLLTGTQWSYLKVPDKPFESLEPDLFNDLWYLQ
ncbi:MAG TPA: DNA methyltransferase [Fimbriimonadaceae bacterium]